MEISWTNTASALQDFANNLCCGKCGSKPESPVRFTNCGHFFCHDCIDCATKCVKCDIPVQPKEIKPDHFISNLIQNCNVIAKIIQKDIWNNTTDAHNTSLDNTISTVLHTSKKQDYIRKRNINKPNPKGETPLHSACLKNNAEGVKRLLLAGADPNTKDNAGWTPLQEMVNYGCIKICELLLECGASPNMSGYKTRTPLHEAVKENRIQEAKLLLHHNANRDQYDQYGKKPIAYCKSKEMRELLMDEPKTEKVSDLNQKLDTSTHMCDKFVILASNLKHENQKLLGLLAARHKFKILTTYRSSVTHVIVEANNNNVTKLTLDVLFTIIHGSWLLNSEWIQLAADMNEIGNVDLELFEVNGAPTYGIPRKARRNAECKNPHLFNNCFFYLSLQANTTYHVGDVRFTKDDLVRLVKEGEGTVLTRKPDPEDQKDMSQVIPFHVASDLSHPLYKCTHYIIYMPGKGEPLIKYNMPHIKSLPLIWLIECIEKFTLVDPAHLGLS